MKKKDYSPKEIKVFNGVMQLIKSGVQLYDIKVQQIADAAGMGKGTLYEYFASREEILAEALIYCMWHEIDTMERMVAKQASFIDKYGAALDFVHDTMTQRASGFTIIATAMHEEGMHKELCAHEQERMALIEHLFDILDAIVECGTQSGEIAHTEQQYSRMVTGGMLFTSAALCSNSGAVDWASIKKDALAILGKSLH